ncbi:unnamed protein product [Lampetra fluviatilis]
MAAHLDITASEGRVVDLSDRGLVRLSAVSLPTDACTLVLDSNNLPKLDGVEGCRQLMQLSAAENSLVRMGGVARLSSLKQLNLPRNSIAAIEGLKDLCHLQWLNLAGNSIKTIEHLNGCTSLTYVDLSDNNISHLGDMSKLSNLRTLLLHGNMVTSLRAAPTHLPPQLGILSLAENEITDLTEMSHLSCLRSLEQLSVMKNPCMLSAPSAPVCDYRPYVLSWCLTLRVLDGHVVTQKESLKAEWLYSQGRGRSFRPGQHAQLIGYLAQVCPQSTSPQLITAEDAKLQKILKQQQRHQKELMEELKEERHRSLSLGASQTPSSLNPGDSSSLTYSELASETPGTVSRQCNRPIKVNLWMGGGGLHEMASPALSQQTAASKLGVRPINSDLHLEDVHSEDDRLGSSMLLSESTFMMCPSLLPSPKSGKPMGIAANDRQMDCTEANAEHLVGEKSPDRRGGGNSPRATDKSTRRHNVKPGLPTERAAREIAPSTGEAFEPICRESPASQESGSPSAGGSNIGGGVAVKLDREAGLVRSFGPRARSAAVRIQAAWRGYHAREHDERVRAARGEMRLRRLQEHVVYLAQELERLRSMHEAERRERLVQAEAVKYLWNQVRTLHEWKEEFTQSLRMQSTFAGQKPEPQEALPLANERPAQGTSDKQSAASVESDASDSDSSDVSDSSDWSEGRPDDTPSHAPQGVAVQSSPSDGEPSLTQEYLHSVQLMVEEEEEKEEMGPEPEGSVSCTLNYETSVNLSGQLPQDDLSERSPVGDQARPEALTAGVPADTVTTVPPGEVLPSAELSPESRSADTVAENGSVDVSEASSGFRVPSLVPDGATCGCESDVHAVSDEAGLDLPKAVSPPPPPLSPPEVGELPPVTAGTVGADDIALAVENAPGGQALGVSVDADGQESLHQLAQTETSVSKQAASLSRASNGHSSLVSLV